MIEKLFIAAILLWFIMGLIDTVRKLKKYRNRSDGPGELKIDIKEIER